MADERSEERRTNPRGRRITDKRTPAEWRRVAAYVGLGAAMTFGFYRQSQFDAALESEAIERDFAICERSNERALATIGFVKALVAADGDTSPGEQLAIDIAQEFFVQLDCEEIRER